MKTLQFFLKMTIVLLVSINLFIPVQNQSEAQAAVKPDVTCYCAHRGGFLGFGGKWVCTARAEAEGQSCNATNTCSESDGNCH